MRLMQHWSMKMRKKPIDAILECHPYLAASATVLIRQLVVSEAQKDKHTNENSLKVVVCSAEGRSW